MEKPIYLVMAYTIVMGEPLGHQIEYVGHDPVAAEKAAQEYVKNSAYLFKADVARAVIHVWENGKWVGIVNEFEERYYSQEVVV